MRKRCEVLVVGAGPVGLVAALMLHKQGVDLQIVDEQWRTAARSYALALHPRSVELLDELGVGRELKEVGHRVETVALYDKTERHAEMRLRDLKSTSAYLLVVPQSALEDTLVRRLEERGVDVLWNHRLSGMTPGGLGITARIDELQKQPAGYGIARTEWVVGRNIEAEARVVLGADGHRSVVRRDLGIDYERLGDAQHFAVFEFTAKQPSWAELRVVVSGGMTSVVWPLGQNRFRWSFQLGESEGPTNPRTKSRLSVHVGDRPFPYLEESQLPLLLAERAPWFGTAIREVAWSLAIRFDRRLVPSLGRANAWILGDAAHLAAPMAIQSMNLGLLEAEDLSRRVREVLRNHASTDIFSEYQRKFHTMGHRLIGAEKRVRAGASAPPWVAENAAQIVGCVPATGEHFDALLDQIGLEVV